MLTKTTKSDIHIHPIHNEQTLLGDLTYTGRGIWFLTFLLLLDGAAENQNLRGTVCTIPVEPIVTERLLNEIRPQSDSASSVSVIFIGCSIVFFFDHLIGWSTVCSKQQRWLGLVIICRPVPLNGEASRTQWFYWQNPCIRLDGHKTRATWLKYVVVLNASIEVKRHSECAYARTTCAVSS